MFKMLIKEGGIHDTSISIISFCFLTKLILLGCFYFKQWYLETYLGIFCASLLILNINIFVLRNSKKAHRLQTEVSYEWRAALFLVLTGGIVNVMPLLFSQISHNRTQVNLILGLHLALPADLWTQCTEFRNGLGSTVFVFFNMSWS